MQINNLQSYKSTTHHTSLNETTSVRLNESIFKLNLFLKNLKNNEQLIIQNDCLTKKPRKWWAIFFSFSESKDSKKVLKTILIKIQQILEKHQSLDNNSLQVKHQKDVIHRIFETIMSNSSLHASIKNSKKLTTFFAKHYIGKIAVINSKMAKKLDSQLQKFISRIAQFFEFFIKHYRFAYLLSLPATLKSLPRPSLIENCQIEKWISSIDITIQTEKNSSKRAIYYLFLEIVKTEKNFNASLGYLLQSDFLQEFMGFQQTDQIHDLLSAIHSSSIKLLQKIILIKDLDDLIPRFNEIFSDQQTMESYFIPFLNWAPRSWEIVNQIQSYSKNNQKMVDDFCENELTNQAPEGVVIKPSQRLIHLQMLIKKISATIDSNDEQEKQRLNKIVEDIENQLRQFDKIIKIPLAP